MTTTTERVATVDSSDEDEAKVSESGNTGKHAKEFSRMRRLKEAKQERVKHLPLFKPNSALLRHFGEQTPSNYDHLPTTAFNGQVLVIHSPQEEAIYASYLRAQKVRVVASGMLVRTPCGSLTNTRCSRYYVLD